MEVRCRCCEGKGKYDEEDVEEAVVLVEGEGRGALEKVFEGEGEAAMGAVVDGRWGVAEVNDGSRWGGGGDWCLTSRWRCADASPLGYPNPWGSTSKNPPFNT